MLFRSVWFDTPILRKPEWQSVQLLPESYADSLEQVWAFMVRHAEKPEAPYQGFKDYEIQKIQRIIDWMAKGSELDPEYVKMQRANFYRFFNEHDQRRGTNFILANPEMTDFWKECKYYALKA